LIVSLVVSLILGLIWGLILDVTLRVILGVILGVIVILVIFRVVHWLNKTMINLFINWMHHIFTSNFTLPTTNRFRRAQIMLNLLTQPGTEIIRRQTQSTVIRFKLVKN